MAHIILSICQVWFRFEFLKSYGQKPNLFLSYSFMESPLYTKRHCAPRLHVPFNQSRHVSGICRGGGLEKLGDFVFACGVAWSLSTNLSFVVLGGNMSSSLIGTLPWNPYWNKTQTLTFEMKVCSGARVVLSWSRRQWNPRPWEPLWWWLPAKGQWNLHKKLLVLSLKGKWIDSHLVYGKFGCFCYKREMCQNGKFYWIPSH